MKLWGEAFTAKIKEHNEASERGDYDASVRIWEEIILGRQREANNYEPKWLVVREKVLQRDSRRCAECGSTERPQVDHIVPESNGGAPFDEANLQVLCRSCHHRKTGLESSQRNLGLID